MVIWQNPSGQGPRPRGARAKADAVQMRCRMSGMRQAAPVSRQMNTVALRLVPGPCSWRTQKVWRPPPSVNRRGSSSRIASSGFRGRGAGGVARPARSGLWHPCGLLQPDRRGSARGSGRVRGEMADSSLQRLAFRRSRGTCPAGCWRALGPWITARAPASGITPRMARDTPGARHRSGPPCRRPESPARRGRPDLLWLIKD